MRWPRSSPPARAPWRPRAQGRPGGCRPRADTATPRDLVRHQRRHRDPGPAHGGRGAARRLPAGAGRPAVDVLDRPGPRRRARACSSGCSAAGGRGRTASTRCAPRASTRGIPLLAFAGEAVPDAELDRAVDGAERASVTEAFAYLVQRRPGEPRAPAALRGRHRAARGLRLRPARRGRRRTASGGRRDRDADRPLVGVVFYRAHLVAGNTQFVDDLCDAIEARRRRRARRVVLLAARRRRARPSLDLAARARGSTCSSPPCSPPAVRPPAPGSPAAPAASTATTGTPARSAALDVPIIQAPSSGQSRRRVARHPTPASARTTPPPASPSPSSTAASSRPSFAFNEVVDDGDELGIVGAAPTARCPTASTRLAGLALPLRPAAPHAGRRERRVAIVLSAPTRPSAAGSATPSGSTPRRRRSSCSTRSRTPGYRVDRASRPTATR